MTELEKVLSYAQACVSDLIERKDALRADAVQKLKEAQQVEQLAVAAMDMAINDESFETYQSAKKKAEDSQIAMDMYGRRVKQLKAPICELFNADTESTRASLMEVMQSEETRTIQKMLSLAEQLHNVAKAYEAKAADVNSVLAKMGYPPEVGNSQVSAQDRATVWQCIRALGSMLNSSFYYKALSDALKGNQSDGK